MTRVQEFARLTSGQVMVAATSVASVLITAGTLGPEGRGKVAFILALCTVMSVVGVLGLYIPVSTFARYNSGPVPAPAIQALFSSVAVVSLSLVVAGQFSVGLLDSQVGALAGALVITTSVITFCQRVLQARVSSIRYLQLSAANSAILLAATLSTLVSASWVTFSCTLVAGQTVVAAVAVRLVARDIGMGLRPFRYPELARLLRTAAPLAFGLVGQILLWRSDTIALGIVRSDATEVAVYSVAAAGTSLVWLPIEGLTLLLYREMATASSDEAMRAAIRRLAGLALIGASLAGVAGSLALVVLTRTMLPAYAPAVPLFVLLMVGVIPAAAGRLLFAASTTVAARGPLRAFTVLAWISPLVYLPAAYLFSATGVALASAGLYVLTTLVLLPVLSPTAVRRWA